MIEGQLTALAEITVVSSMIAGVILMFLMVTIFFRKTVEVERRIATPGKQLDGIRIVWGNGPIGRWMRVVHIYAFFVYRNVPCVGKRIEARMGDESEPLPLSLKLWVTIPFTVYAVFMFLFFLSGWYLGALD